ncbi:hypothetical protein AWENTII_005182 [Aspergillus wentii]|nr:hypothetical protein MW887_008761 [Aspergillus wentii]
MQQVQAEIDRHIGSERLPTLADLPQLPYTQAFICECSRLSPISPFGLHRAVSQEDEYMGYRIPADATILPFLWGMNMDETIHPNPTFFQPQRWIDNPTLSSPDAFGFGKRLCPGKPIAERMIFITIACVAWGYDFTAADGFEYQADKYNLFSTPSTSAIRVLCRSPAHRATIERVHREADLRSEGI